MNKRKWKDPSVPLTILALKLCEEAGEVATEVADAHFVDLGYGFATGTDTEAVNRTIEELDHVMFIAKTLKRRLVIAKEEVTHG